jgi:hypothetical protein
MKIEIFNIHCFWKGCAALIISAFIEDFFGINFIATFIDNNYKGGAHFIFALLGVFFLGSLIHNFINFEIIIKKIFK